MTQKNIVYPDNKYAQSGAAIWNALPWVDRKLYYDPFDKNLVQPSTFEPAISRNGTKLEFHIIAATGCNWKCNFCTESKINGNHGETRRSASDVIREINFLLEPYQRETTVGVQFVEDNIFPSIIDELELSLANSKKNVAENYAQILLEGLSKIREQYPFFSWRGLMRLEDYKNYEKINSNFSELLSKSGCKLLGFGIESGNEVARKSLKAAASNLSNIEIVNLVSKLHSVNIAVKGYFMIGEPAAILNRATLNNIDLVSETINLAIEAKFDVAYFSIYKDFSTAVINFSNLRTKKNTDQTAKQYELLEFDLLQFTKSTKTSLEWAQAFNKDYKISEINSFKDALINLSAVGFNFSDLFKYNDFHIQAPSAKNKTIDVPLSNVRRAYLEFYGRQEYVATYQAIVSSGY